VEKILILLFPFLLEYFNSKGYDPTLGLKSSNFIKTSTVLAKLLSAIHSSPKKDNHLFTIPPL
jgi:hypothetical protein